MCFLYPVLAPFASGRIMLETGQETDYINEENQLLKLELGKRSKIDDLTGLLNKGDVQEKEYE